MRHVDSPTRAGSGGDERVMFALHRSVAAGTAVGAHLFVAVHNETQKIVGSASFYGPGVEMCGEYVSTPDLT